MAFTAEPILLG